MRDLKHLTYFEDLLQEANNALVVQAQAEGKKCVAFVCENTPEPLMNLDNTFGVRLHAPNTGSMDIATYYMTSLLCETSRLPARACGRGRLQLCRLRHRARRLHDDQPLRGEHGAAQDHGRRQGSLLL